MSVASHDRASWSALQRRIIACKRCPRLREHCEHIALEKRAAFREWTYWGKPVPNFGNPDARMLLIGLAPAAHGSNRTGRCFTGDRAGDFLFRAMYETGFATQPTSRHRDDGLELIDATITAVCHCAPPDNKPTPAEIIACDVHMQRTVRSMGNLQIVLALGRIAFDATVRIYRQHGWLNATERPKFAHGAEFSRPGIPTLLSAFHPSQQNTFTGRLTPEMMRAIFVRARQLLQADPAS